MFIYQTKKLYNEDGDGPFDALVVTNGEQGEKPAEVGQTVMALTQETVTEDETTTHNVLFDDEFIVGDGTKPEPAFYQADFSGEEPVFTKLDKNYVETESIEFVNGQALIYVEDTDVPDISRIYSNVSTNVSTITAKTSEGNQGEGYELNVITDIIEFTNFYSVLVYDDGEALPDDFFTQDQENPTIWFTNLTLSLPNDVTYTVKLYTEREL